MRTPSITLTAVLALSACSSGIRTIVIREPAPAPDPVVVAAPEPERLQPLEITVGRPVARKLYVQTNRPAYVAIFEIVPGQGVTLVHPSAARGRKFVLSGLSSVPVWWPTRRTVVYRRPSYGKIQPERYVYALASDEPLRLPEAAFQPGYLRQALGLRAYRAADPYATMRAISDHFVPTVDDEQWAEDVYGLVPSYADEPYRVIRAYCPDGTVYELPADMVDDVWCPTYRRITAGGAGRTGPTKWEPPTRPDSLLGDDGRRVRPRARGPLGRARGWVDRVSPPAADSASRPRSPGNAGDSRGNNGNNGNHGDGNNGRALGHEKSPEPRGRGADTTNGVRVRGRPEMRPIGSSTLSRTEPTVGKPRPNGMSDAEPGNGEEQRASAKPVTRGKPETRGKPAAEPRDREEAGPARGASEERTPAAKAEGRPERHSGDEAETPRAKPTKAESRGNSEGDKSDAPAERTKARGKPSRSDKQSSDRDSTPPAE